MKPSRLAVPVILFFLAATSLGTARLYGAPQQGPPPGYGHDRGGWDTPPGELNEIQRQGFRDGIDGARKDLDNHRRPNVNNRDEYRHPHVPSDQRDAYREGFRRGYEQAMSHLMGGGERR